MVFSSSVFLFAFLPVTLILYFLPYKHVMTKNIILLVMSLIFYGWGEPKYILVMIFSILMNYVIARIIGKHKSKLMLTFAAVINLGLLGYFKYTDFFIDTINKVANLGLGNLGVILPIGISFYTFQALSYVIDVYRGKVEAQKNPIIVATYITMFPQLIAGPIVRYSDVEKQLISRKNSADNIAIGIRRFAIGLSKKVLIANQLALVWDDVYGQIAAGYEVSMGAAWLGALAFTLQIYYDFSGYSDMAIGLGKILGFDFLENFNFPYISRSITEFWRRWHMSLSSWFKEYVYIPLGGNRKGLPRQIVNIFIVWGLTGLWHGASWNFVLWGLYYGILLIVEKIFMLDFLERHHAFGHIYTLILVIFGWVLFNITDFAILGEYIKAMFNFGCLIDETFKYDALSYIGPFVIGIFFSKPFANLDPNREVSQLDIKYTVGLLAISICFIVGGTYNPFLYFRF